MRPSWREYFLDKARVTATRSACTRAQHGAVIVRHNIVAGEGYNGFPPGMVECSGGGCPRGRHYPDTGKPQAHLGIGAFITAQGEKGRCGCGKEWPCPDAVPSMSSYDSGPGMCLSVHAEINAIMHSSRWDRLGATMYITGKPCFTCRKITSCSGITRMIWPDGELDFPFLSEYTPAP